MAAMIPSEILPQHWKGSLSEDHSFVAGNGLACCFRYSLCGAAGKRWHSYDRRIAGAPCHGDNAQALL